MLDTGRRIYPIVGGSVQTLFPIINNSINCTLGTLIHSI